jgi:hypothetical protein
MTNIITLADIIKYIKFMTIFPFYIDKSLYIDYEIKNTCNSFCAAIFECLNIHNYDEAYFCKILLSELKKQTNIHKKYGWTKQKLMTIIKTNDQTKLEFLRYTSDYLQLNVFIIKDINVYFIGKTFNSNLKSIILIEHSNKYSPIMKLFEYRHPVIHNLLTNKIICIDAATETHELKIVSGDTFDRNYDTLFKNVKIKYIETNGNNYTDLLESELVQIIF